MSHVNWVTRTPTALILATAALVAIAVTWGPFLMRLHSPGLTYEADRDNSFVAAGNLPRQVMGPSVQNIKSGDAVRVIYDDGRIFDFEVTARCSFVTSVACQVGKATQMGQVEDPANPTPSAIRAAIRAEYGPEFFQQGCNGMGGGTTYGPSDIVEVTTGYWQQGSTTILPGNVVQIVASRWVDTGIAYVAVQNYAPGGTGYVETCR